jgi:hypothetical protein
MLDYGSAGAAVAAGALSGATLGIISGAATDNYRLTVKVAERNGNALKTYEFEDAVQSWFGIWFVPGVAGLTEDLFPAVFENMLRHVEMKKRFGRLWTHAMQCQKRLPDLSWAAWVTVTLVILSACTTTVPLATDTALSVKDAPKKIPLTVGIYYSPEFLSYQGKMSISEIDDVIIPVGAASVGLFDQAVHLVFEQTIPVSGRPPVTHTKGVDAVIEPRIEAFDGRMPRDFAAGTVSRVGVDSPHAAALRYRIILYDRVGNVVISWVVFGANFIQMAGPFRRSTGEAVNGAILHAMRSFVMEFGELPEVLAWINDQRIR